MTLAVPGQSETRTDLLVKVLCMLFTKIKGADVGVREEKGCMNVCVWLYKRISEGPKVHMCPVYD